MTRALDDGIWRPRSIRAAGIGITAFEAGNPAPDARTIVLIHGLGHWTQAAWDALVPLLDADLRIIAFDLPGFGQSEKPAAAYDTAFFGRVVNSALAQLSSGPLILCGHSLGGYIAANYAAARPERIEQLILIAPAGFLRAARFVYMLLGSQLARWFFTRRPGHVVVNGTLDRSVVDPRSISAAIRERAFELASESAVRRAFAAVYSGALRDFCDLPLVHRRLGAWTGPTLLVWGRHDRFIPIKALPIARAVYPQANVLICEHSGHLPMVEEASLVARHISAFVDRRATHETDDDDRAMLEDDRQAQSHR